MDSRRVWDEVSLLRTCVHRRLVALLGVACQVRGARGVGRQLLERSVLANCEPLLGHCC